MSSILQCLYIITNSVRRVSSDVTDLNTQNKLLTAKLLNQGYRYHKLHRAFSKFYRCHYIPGILRMPKGYIVFISFVHLSILPSVLPSSFCPSFCPSVILSINTCYNQVLLRSFLITYITAATYQKLFILFGTGRMLFRSTSMDPLGHAPGMGRGLGMGGGRGLEGQNLGYLNKVVYFSLFIQTTS